MERFVGTAPGGDATPQLSLGNMEAQVEKSLRLGFWHCLFGWVF